MNKKTLIVAVALVAQVAAISWLIWRYERIVRSGTEVRFACQAYDPYDPLRGRYLQTSVREECTNLVISGTLDGNLYSYRHRLFARLEPASSNGLWRVGMVAEQPQGEGLWIKPKSSTLDYRMRWNEKRKDERYDDFENRRKASGVLARVDMPDQLFLNEKLAPEAEEVLRKATGKSAVAVYRVLDGEIVITDIEIDGKSITQLVKEQK